MTGLAKSLGLSINSQPPYFWLSVSCWQFLDVLHGLGRVLEVSTSLVWQSWYLEGSTFQSHTAHCILVFTACAGHLSSFHFLCTDAIRQILSSDGTSSTARVVIAQGVAVTATNLTNSSETLCTDEDSACLFSWSKRDNGSAMFCSPGKYLTLNLYGCNRRIHLSIRAHGFALLE